MFIDTHCHLSKEDYDDIQTIIEFNREAKVDKIIVSACSYDSIVEDLEYKDTYPDVYLTIGYHPSEVATTNNERIEYLKSHIKDDKVVGIGEIGLDYHYGIDDRLQQIKLFKMQLAMAEENNLPVVIHSRDAFKDTVDCLSNYKVTGVIHCFSGTVQEALNYISMGFKLGIGGVVTFKNSNLPEVVKAVGINNIVLETDSPYLAPVPLRGTKNSSRNIPYIALKISEILGISVTEVGRITSENACNIYKI